MGRMLIDLTGRRFGGLVVQSKACTIERVYWKCVCDCGGTAIVAGSSLKTGGTKSCGCLKSNWGNGQTKTKEYRAWASMIQRCVNVNVPNYDNYGGRGITVYSHWLASFENFLADVGKAPTSKHTLDRIDVNGNYEPGNVRWATWTMQAQNRRLRFDNTFGVPGVEPLPKGLYRVRIGVNNKLIHLGNFATLDDAIAARKQAERLYWEKV